MPNKNKVNEADVGAMKTAYLQALEMRDKWIVELAKLKVPVKEIARLTKLKEVTVYQILRKNGVNLGSPQEEATESEG